MAALDSLFYQTGDDTVDITFRNHLKCPFCGRGEILTDRRVKVSVSTICPICNNLYFASLYTLRTCRPKDMRQMGKRPFNRIAKCPYEGCAGELRADGEADVRVSLRCAKSNCRRFYIVDLSTMTSYPSKPSKRYGRTK